MTVALLSFGALFVAEALYQRRKTLLAEFVRSLRVLAPQYVALGKVLERTGGLMSGVSASFETAKKVLADLRADKPVIRTQE